MIIFFILFSYLIDKWFLSMLEFDRIDLSKRIHVAKCNNSKKCIICHYWYFIGGFKFQKLVCYGCHDFLMLRLRISDITIITDKDIITVFFSYQEIFDDCGFI